MEFNANLFKPFGPFLMESDCPDFIVDQINNRVDEILSDENLRKENSNFSGEKIPNLLNRDLENIFLEYEFCEEIGLTDYVEYISNEYISESIEEGLFGEWAKENKDVKLKLQSLEEISDKNFADAWVNIYHENDFTPIHDHGGVLSGVMILEFPEEINEYPDASPLGKLNFAYGSNNQYEQYEYYPEQYVGKTIIFPNRIPHIYYPHRISGKQRRSLSFNMALDD